MITFLERIFLSLMAKIHARIPRREVINSKILNLECQISSLALLVKSLQDDLVTTAESTNICNELDSKLNALSDEISSNKSLFLMQLISDFDYRSWLTGNGCPISESSHLYDSSVIWDYAPYSYWLYLASSLIEKNNIIHAEKIVKKYFKVYNGVDVERYPLVASLCGKLGLLNINIKKSAFVIEKLNKNKNLLHEITFNKSVALVGNGPSEVGTNNGKFIDDYDVVIRFNNFITDGFEEDYGKKVDVWVRGSAGDDIIKSHDISDLSGIIWEADYLHFPFHYNDLDTIYSQLNSSPDKISNFDFLSHNLLSSKYNINYPTTGLLTIFYLFTLANPKKIGLYGFSYKEENPTYVNEHYFSDRSYSSSQERIWKHDMALESEIINDIIKNSDLLS